jgi:DUF971 family protein
MSEQQKTPKDIAVMRSQQLIRIEWNDGKVCDYSWEFLRRQCPCATCGKNLSDEHAESRNLMKSQITIKNVLPVGRYALKLIWQDGHATGIYSYEYLRELCR